MYFFVFIGENKLTYLLIWHTRWHFWYFCVSPETRNKYSRFRSYTSRTKNSATTNNILCCGVKYKGSNLRIFHNRCIFCVVMFDVIQRHPFYFLHLQNTKGSLPLYGSNSKGSNLFSNTLFHIQHVIAFSNVLNILTRPQCIEIILIIPKYVLQIEDIRFFKTSLTAGLNTSYGILRWYFCWKNIGIRSLMAFVWCSDRYGLVLSDLVHVNQLWDMANGGGRKLSFTTFL